MRRLILLIAIGLVVFWIIRRAAAKKMPAGKRGEGLPGSPPKSLVCGSCGFEFDPEVSGWMCPKCHK
jgi:predicted Zn-ribbon and HTH transcriptional regulator